AGSHDIQQVFRFLQRLIESVDVLLDALQKRRCRHSQQGFPPTAPSRQRAASTTGPAAWALAGIMVKTA
ncbi:MAG TPA: hypothetical protein VEY05_12510, partial [Beijerinckiaceae bacterium]|nr:hypothetical protein [Beijerinckiaceae bacterium]